MQIVNDEIRENDILSMEEARTILRVDGEDLDGEIVIVLKAIPSYLETCVDMKSIDNTDPMLKMVARIFLLMWFESDEVSKNRYQFALDNLVANLSVKSRGVS